MGVTFGPRRFRDRWRRLLLAVCAAGSVRQGENGTANTQKTRRAAMLYGSGMVRLILGRILPRFYDRQRRTAMAFRAQSSEVDAHQCGGRRQALPALFNKSWSLLGST